MMPDAVCYLSLKAKQAFYVPQSTNQICPSCNMYAHIWPQFLLHMTTWPANWNCAEQCRKHLVLSLCFRFANDLPSNRCLVILDRNWNTWKTLSNTWSQLARNSVNAPEKTQDVLTRLFLSYWTTSWTLRASWSKEQSGPKQWQKANPIRFSSFNYLTLSSSLIGTLPTAQKNNLMLLA